MNFRSWQRWQLIEYALLQKISEEKAVENGKTLPQTKQEYAYALITDSNGNSVTNTEFNIVVFYMKLVNYLVMKKTENP
jgi:hypothetical protein|nr:MAG TPA: hypothetical protein [Caudoviricetes sp.]